VDLLNWLDLLDFFPTKPINPRLKKAIVCTQNIEGLKIKDLTKMF
jgi:hypothetical protein